MTVAGDTERPDIETEFGPRDEWLFDPRHGKPLTRLQWQLRLPDGGTFKLWDLPVGKTVKLSAEFSMGWAEIVDRPLTGDGSLALSIYNTVCRHAGQDPKSGDDMSMRELSNTFEVVADDKPTIYEDGLPKAGDETPTG